MGTTGTGLREGSRSPPRPLPRTISASTQVQGGEINLYENMRCHGVPLVTISRGRVVYENGVFMCAEGTGKFCPLRSFPDSVYKKLVQREKVRGDGDAGPGCAARGGGGASGAALCPRGRAVPRSVLCWQERGALGGTGRAWRWQPTGGSRSQEPPPAPALPHPLTLR